MKGDTAASEKQVSSTFVRALLSGPTATVGLTGPTQPAYPTHIPHARRSRIVSELPLSVPGARPSAKARSTCTAASGRSSVSVTRDAPKAAAATVPPTFRRPLLYRCAPRSAFPCQRLAGAQDG